MVRISWSIGPVRSEEYTHPTFGPAGPRLAGDSFWRYSPFLSKAFGKGSACVRRLRLEVLLVSRVRPFTRSLRECVVWGEAV